MNSVTMTQATVLSYLAAYKPRLRRRRTRTAARTLSNAHTGHRREPSYGTTSSPSGARSMCARDFASGCHGYGYLVAAEFLAK